MYVCQPKCGKVLEKRSKIDNDIGGLDPKSYLVILFCFVFQHNTTQTCILVLLSSQSLSSRIKHSQAQPIKGKVAARGDCRITANSILY